MAPAQEADEAADEHRLAAVTPEESVHGFDAVPVKAQS
jgi:hypothetical protein